jgi:hypothetical protein
MAGSAAEAACSLEALDQRCDTHISSLDHALNVISQIGVLYKQMSFNKRKELLRLTVKQVILNRECEVVDVELLPPFIYLSDLGGAVQNGGRGDGPTGIRQKKTRAWRAGFGLRAWRDSNPRHLAP